MRHFYGHLLLAVAWMAGATEEDLAPRYARMPCRHRRILNGHAQTAAAVVALTALAVITVALAYLAARSVT